MRKLLLLGVSTTATSVLLFVSANVSAAAFYLRPDGDLFNSKPWSPVGAATRWEALDDPITETETPSTADYIQADGSRESKVTLTSINILGSGISQATIWYYAGNSQPFEVKSSLDTTWQLSNTAGWHSRTETISSQIALSELYLQFRTGSGSSLRQVRAAFLKVVPLSPKVYWGAWMDGDVYKETNPGLGDAPWDQTTWNLFEEHAKKPASIVHFGQPPPWEQKFSAEPLEKSKARGALPLMDMGTGFIPGKPHTEKEPDNRVSLKEINEGLYDSYFKEWAEAVAAYKYPFFFRWAWEMNGTWFKWGKDAAASPEEFVKAWQRIHNIAAEKGASNITWVWCPNVELLGGTPYSQLYPGDAYVNWTCLDGYNEGGSTFQAIFESSYNSLTKTIAPSKPVMIGETADEDEGNGHLSKDTWIEEAIHSLSSNFPQIKAFAWFNWNIVEKGKEWLWPIEFGGGQSTFAYEISTPYFAANEFGSPATLEPIQPLP